MKSQLWYYQSGGTELGPVTADELLFLVRSGQIGRQVIVRADGTGVGQPFAKAFPVTGHHNPRSAADSTTTPASRTIAPGTVRPAVALPKAGGHSFGTIGYPDRAASPAMPSLPPPLQPSANGSRTPALAVSAFVLALLLAVCLWWLWPRNPPGLAADGTGAGLAADGEQQATDAQQTTGANSAAPAQTPSAAAAASGAASATATDTRPDAAADTTARADQPDTADNVADAGKAAPAAPAGDIGTTTSEPAAGKPADDAAEGLAVGSGGDERFSISAPGETTFFGLRGQGRRFSWVVDCSGSMQGPPLERARQELLKSLRKLPQGLEFQVIFFDDLPRSYPAVGFAEMDSQTLAAAESFISDMQGGGGTNVIQAMRQVFSQTTRPDTTFLLTDGEFDPETPQFIQRRNSGGKVRINTVAFVNRAGEPLLRQIAHENRGDFRFVP